MKPSRTRFRIALEIQDASNPSGVTLCLQNAIAERRAEIIHSGGTIQEDPACILIAFKLAEMFNLMASNPIIHEAWRECRNAISEEAENQSSSEAERR